ncbi:alpha/beta hydrolase [Aureimonas sp. AU4]|uniref:RBBP9/YdeN family alpha/beta hydrolase n=1 Tax=Aureimonas sp. AU4 TaxID=1638163 RepID=UPI0009E8246C|nr:alpha/beta hydrolase [Aureimonas sp. AU4]
MIQTLIVPGLNGSPEGHWQHFWAHEDAGAELVDQEDWARPRLTDWLHALEARIAASAPGVILVAHSLGCALVGALSQRPSASHVGGALLVAPADVSSLTRSHPTAADFDVGTSRTLPFASIVVASRNDPFMKFERAEEHAGIWGSALIDLGAAGHINIGSGYGRWPDAAILAEGLRGRPARDRIGPSPARRWWNEIHPRSASAHDVGLGIV